ncbi:hypothetical protein DVH05_027019 [Phytophthora capsici]|nr:hypothetical protein DVH05_027019 [Phytophthora capsici]
MGSYISHFYSEYEQEIRVIFEDPNGKITELTLRKGEPRRVAGYGKGQCSVYVYLPNTEGKFKDKGGEGGGGGRPVFKNYFEKRTVEHDRSFIIDSEGRLHLQKYGAALNVREGY